ncbi:MAG TPA: transporter substrate-binding domain-containing protein [Cellvibrio sp.]|nr:transporter substrate-binding domain-containing protein [Cellvibrio sp.]
MLTFARALCAFVVLVGTLCHAAQPIPLIIPPLGSMEPETTGIYYEKLLQLALDKTATPPDSPEAINEVEYKITHYNQALGRERYRLLVKQGAVDLMWSSSNKEREQELVPVKVNLLRGINEYRVLLIRADDQARFDKVKTLMDLQKFKIGTGLHWSDTQVYNFNDLPMVTSYAFDNMFRMLALKRFDYMARSLQEIEHELKVYGDLGLVMEKNLLIHYPQPIYFFLNKKHHALAKRIERGLSVAQQDGSLDELFYSFPNFRSAEEKIRHLDRRVIELQRQD